MQRSLPTAAALLCLVGGPLLVAPPTLADGPRSTRSELFGLRESGVLAVAQEDSVATVDVGADVRPERLAATRFGWVLTGIREGADAPHALALWARDASGEVRELPGPEVRPGRVLRDPVPLLDRRHDLGAMVWLEGADPESLAVRHATWTGAAWQHPIQLVPEGPGSQLALDAVRLSDEAHLLVWTRYDGEDDEVVWSRLDAEGATEPRRVHGNNEVPDITPALVATGDEVLVAWSGYDGNDYRLHLARFTGDDWFPVGTLPGRAAVFPSWQRTASGDLFLVYREGAEARWVVARLDPRGRMVDIARVAGSYDATPRVESLPGGEAAVFPSGRSVTLRWEPVPRLP